MDPINAINQEFVRKVVEDWSDEATIRRQEEEATESRGGIGATLRALVIWMHGRIEQREGSGETARLSEAANR